jgi:hypothetical protein
MDTASKRDEALIVLGGLKHLVDNPPASYDYLRDPRNRGYVIRIEVDRPIQTWLQIVLKPNIKPLLVESLTAVGKTLGNQKYQINYSAFGSGMIRTPSTTASVSVVLTPEDTMFDVGLPIPLTWDQIVRLRDVLNSQEF